MVLEWHPDVHAVLLDEYDPHYGARSLQHAIDVLIINKLAMAHEQVRSARGRLENCTGCYQRLFCLGPNQAKGQGDAACQGWVNRVGCQPRPSAILVAVLVLQSPPDSRLRTLSQMLTIASTFFAHDGELLSVSI